MTLIFYKNLKENLIIRKKDAVVIDLRVIKNIANVIIQELNVDNFANVLRVRIVLIIIRFNVNRKIIRIKGKLRKYYKSRLKNKYKSNYC